MATLADVTKQLSESTTESVAETKKLNKLFKKHNPDKAGLPFPESRGE